MRFSIKVNEEDYIKFNHFHILNSKKGKRALRLFRLTGLLSCLVILLILLILNTRYLSVAGSFLLLVCIFWILSSKKLFERMIDRKSSVPFNEDMEVIFSKQYIILRGKEGSLSLKYEDVKKVCKNGEYLYIYKDENKAIIIPLLYLGNKKEEAECFLNEKIKVSGNRFQQQI